ncbi:GATA transcription factor 10-like [Phragmites australis]|uniref:GATA transcription factor 10-like n=1 Tax=Phragmites australis TaxID=29695 RepID=UPI002D781F0E|nr:GATA transcription factor 10-like [Phragmites australis]
MSSNPSYVSLHDVPEDLADCDGSSPGGGLCCPDDPLDIVLQYFPAPVADDGFLEALGITSSPQRHGRGDEDGESKCALGGVNAVGEVRMLAAAARTPGGGGERDVRGFLSRGASEVQEVVDVDMFFADAAPDDGGCGGGEANVWNNMSCHTAVTSALPAGGLDGCGALDGFVSDAALSDRPLTTSSASSGSLSSTTWETEPPALVLPPHAWTVTRKQRHRPVIRRNHLWLPKSSLPHDVPDAPHDNPSHKSGASDAGIHRRRPEARQRSRQTPRVCSHCDSSDTPQWRAGPGGARTLCNACGIRYKNNKLLPEYRPSTSPGFRSDEHSNRHRKVVKLREQKAKEKILRLMADTVPAAPAPAPNSGEFMDMCTYVSTG